MNKTARIIVNYCIDNDIGNLVVGYDETFQTNSNIGKVNNQTFVNIPYGQLRLKLEYICKLNGIVFVKQEESYTSNHHFGIKITFLSTIMTIHKAMHLVESVYTEVCINVQMENVLMLM